MKKQQKKYLYTKGIRNRTCVCYLSLSSNPTTHFMYINIQKYPQRYPDISHTTFYYFFTSMFPIFFYFCCFFNKIHARGFEVERERRLSSGVGTFFASSFYIHVFFYVGVPMYVKRQPSKYIFFLLFVLGYVMCVCECVRIKIPCYFYEK